MFVLKKEIVYFLKLWSIVYKRHLNYTFLCLQMKKNLEHWSPLMSTQLKDSKMHGYGVYSSTSVQLILPPPFDSKVV